jgi:hypothetical protein
MHAIHDFIKVVKCGGIEKVAAAKELTIYEASSNDNVTFTAPIGATA